MSWHCNALNLSIFGYCLEQFLILVQPFKTEERAHSQEVILNPSVLGKYKTFTRGERANSILSELSSARPEHSNSHQNPVASARLPCSCLSWTGILLVLFTWQWRSWKWICFYLINTLQQILGMEGGSEHFKTSCPLLALTLIVWLSVRCFSGSKFPYLLVSSRA